MASIFSGPGVAIATALHTFGAIGYLAGIALYIAWHRGLRRGHEHTSTLGLGAAVTYVSIMANLAGGFIKTYIPGHPSLSAIATEPWVLNMTLKHVVLFAGMFAAIWLFEMEAPRLRRRFKEGKIETISPTRSNVLSTVVIVSIFVAAIQGGAATVMEIGGMDDVTPTENEGARPDPIEAGPYRFSGQLTSNPSGSSSRGEFLVTEGATRIIAHFEAMAPGAAPINPNQFTVVLRDSTGESTSGSTDPQDPTAARVIDLIIDDVRPGTWTYDVQGDVAIAADWALDIELEYGNVVEGTVDIPDGGFFEINLETRSGIVIAWDWTADTHLDWNVHTHFDGVTEYVEQGHADGHVGDYTTQREGGHSIMWEAFEGDATLSYRVTGDFTVDSIVGPTVP